MVVIKIEEKEEKKKRRRIRRVSLYTHPVVLSRTSTLFITL